MRELTNIELENVSGGWAKILGQTIGGFITAAAGIVAKDQYDKSQEDDNDNDNDDDSGSSSGGGS